MALFQNKKKVSWNKRISNVPTYANSRLAAKLSIFTLSTPANSAFTNVTHEFRKESLYVFRVLHPFFLCTVVPFFLKKEPLGTVKRLLQQQANLALLTQIHADVLCF